MGCCLVPDIPITLAAYRKAYNRGWRHSATSRHSLDNNPYPWVPKADPSNTAHTVANGLNNAWEDGYLDYAAGREKWHLLHCEDHDNCP